MKVARRVGGILKGWLTGLLESDVWRWWREPDRQWCGVAPADGLFVIGLRGLLTSAERGTKSNVSH